MKTTVFTLLLILTSSIYSQSSYTNIQIINTGGPNEPSICINPKNLNQIVAGTNTDDVYRSSDGGLTWVNSTLTGTYTVWGDPCIITDTVGNFYYFHLVNGASFIDRMGVNKSTNAGATWNAGTYWQFNGKKQDKEWAITDFTHGPRGNWIYVTWTEFDQYYGHTNLDSSRIFFARSTDGGNSFTGIIKINTINGNCDDEDYTTEGAVPAVGPNGEVYVAWSGPMGLNNFKIFFDKSTDGGSTWLPNDIVACSQRGGWDYVVAGIQRSNGLPITLCDISNSPYRGTIYINYTDSAGPADHDVMVVKSTNGGTTWSAPIRINDDPAGKEQFFTWMSIDQVTGYLYCVFYDRRNYTNTQTDVYMARSTNGGTTWTNERISTSPFTPISNIFFGDYTNISSHNGMVRPIWTRLDNVNLSLYTAIINFPVGVEPVSTEIPAAFSLKQNYPNPFNPNTTFEFDVPAFTGSGTQDVSIKVYDILGNETAVIVNGNLAPGSYKYEWDASLQPSGVYFYKMQSGSYSETKKMILAK